MLMIWKRWAVSTVLIAEIAASFMRYSARQLETSPFAGASRHASVSYTHLTLPTILLV